MPAMLPNRHLSEVRYEIFGRSAGVSKVTANPVDLCLAVIKNIANWYAWGVFDWVFGERIEVHCQDVPNILDTKCETRVGSSSQRIGAYALSETTSQIVICPGFYDHPTLDEATEEVKKVEWRRKDTAWMKTRGHLFFHEMTHLARITETKTGTNMEANERMTELYPVSET